MEFNDRRKVVEAAARAGSIKAMPKKNKVSEFKVNKMATRAMAGTVHVGRDVQVTEGSKRQARLQKKQAWAKQYSKDQTAKYNAKMAGK